MKAISAPRTGVDAANRAERGLGPFATHGRPIYSRHPYLPKGSEGGTMLNHRVGRRVSVSQEDQFQRNGVILDQRSGVWNDDTGAASRGGAGRLYWHL
jgi:hypothetical protein